MHFFPHFISALVEAMHATQVEIDAHAELMRARYVKLVPFLSDALTFAGV